MGITISHRERRDICEAARFNSRRFLMDRNDTVANAGKSPIKTKTMNTTSTISLAYRKQLADLLKKYGPLREQADALYQTKYQKAEQSLLKDYFEEKKGKQAMSKITAIQAELDLLKEGLSTIGIELDGDSLSIGWGAPDSLKRRIREQIEQQIGKRSDIEARFESARLAVMTVPTLEDAQKILESVSELCG
jgi:hypothetical protein